MMDIEPLGVGDLGTPLNLGTVNPNFGVASEGIVPDELLAGSGYVGADGTVGRFNLISGGQLTQVEGNWSAAEEAFQNSEPRNAPWPFGKFDGEFSSFDEIGNYPLDYGARALGELGQGFLAGAFGGEGGLVDDAVTIGGHVIRRLSSAGLGALGRAAPVGVPAKWSTNPMSPVLEFDAHGNEILYRAMSGADFQYLSRYGALPATSETFVSPLAAYSQAYEGTLVRFAVKPGTMNSLMGVGVSHSSTARLFPELQQAVRGWTGSSAMFKLEGVGQSFNRGLGVVNTGLGRGPALNMFNQGIVQFERVTPTAARAATNQ